MAWLDDNPPTVRQFRCPRRATPSGVVVVHTAESIADESPPDRGAENVALFIQRRTNLGSYHDLADSDSILQLVEYDCEAFHDATGSNPHSYGVSAACQAARWHTYSPTWRNATVVNMAKAAARYAAWIQDRHGVAIPARRISRVQSEAKMPGFISHAERDPGRRTDPGAGFPWALFLDTYAALVDVPTPPPTPPPTPGKGVPDMLVVQYGRSAFRLITGDRMIPISQEAADMLARVGIPRTGLPNEDVERLQLALVSEE